MIRRIAGTGTGAAGTNGTLPTRTDLLFPRDVKLLPNGDLLVADTGNGTVRTTSQAMAGQVIGGGQIRIAEEDGSVVYVFDDKGRHLRTEDADTGQTLVTFGYGVFSGRAFVTSVTDAFSNVTQIERDSTTGKPTAIVAPFGQRTELTIHPSSGWLASVENPEGETVSFTYTTGGLLDILTDPKSGEHDFDYDALGRLIKDTNPANGFTALARTDTANGSVITKSTAMGRATVFATEHLASGATQQTTTQPDGISTVLLIGIDGSRTLTHADGTVATMTETVDPRFGLQAPRVSGVTLTTPGGLDHVTTTTRTVARDPLTQAPTSITENVVVNGRTATSVRDLVNRSLTTTSPGNRQGVSQFDLFGRLVQSSAGGLQSSVYAYDTHGRLHTVTSGSRVVTYAYDTDGFLASVTDPASRTVSFEYDEVGRITKQILPDLRQILYSYDDNGNLTSITPPSRPAHQFGYTAADLPETYTAPNLGGPRTTTFAYNLDHQVTSVTRPDGQAITHTYGATTGRLESITTPLGSYTYTYHPTTGTVISVTDPTGGSLAYTYDGSLPLTVTWSGAVSGSIQQVYNDDFRVATRTVNGTDPITFSHDIDGFLEQAGALSLTHHAQSGLLTGTTLGDVADTIGYNAFGERTSYSASYDGTEIFETTFTRDNLGRITQKVETLGGVTDTYDYTYDPAGRLTEVEKNGVVWAEYGYDGNSNRLTATDPVGTYAGTYDDQDRLLTYGAATYTYTDNGEILTKTVGSATVTYGHDVLGNLRTVELANGIDLEYVIDAANRRVGKKVNGTLVKGFLYANQLSPIVELDGSNAVVSRFVYGSRGNVPDYMIKGGVTYRLIADYLGSVRLVVDIATGTVAQRLDYDPFGRILLDTNPGFQPFGFAGGLYDPQTGLVRFGARDYDTETGRWTSKDPIGFGAGDTNLYGYVLNDPINFLDPSGHFGVLDGIQLGLDIAGLIPGLGEPLDLLNGVISLARGDCVGAALSFAAAVPLVGMAATLGKGLKYSDEVMAAARQGGPDSVGAMRRLRYEASEKHGPTARGRASAGPRNGQDALDSSLQVKPTSPRRVGIDYEAGEFVVFDLTSDGVFHGHVRSWSDLEPQMQNTLVNASMADRKGRILTGE